MLVKIVFGFLAYAGVASVAGHPISGKVVAIQGDEVSCAPLLPTPTAYNLATIYHLMSLVCTAERFLLSLLLVILSVECCYNEHKTVWCVFLGSPGSPSIVVPRVWRRRTYR